jgi:hypothetical protein
MGRNLLASSDLAVSAAKVTAESERAGSTTGAVIVLHQEER